MELKILVKGSSFVWYVNFSSCFGVYEELIYVRIVRCIISSSCRNLMFLPFFSSFLGLLCYRISIVFLCFQSYICVSFLDSFHTQCILLSRGSQLLRSLIFNDFNSQANTHINVHQDLKDVKLWEVGIITLYALAVSVISIIHDNNNY